MKKFTVNEYTTIHKVKDIMGLLLMTALMYVLITILFLA